MAEKKAPTINLLPADDEVNGAGSQADNVGKTSVPLFLILRCHPFSNTPGTRANPKTELQKFILPFPESAPTGLNVRYNEELAKEQGIVAKIFTETANLASNFLSLPGRIVKDSFQSLSGVDLGRRPMNVTELSFIKAEKRQYNFNWVFTSISKSQSDSMVDACNKLTSFSLPSTAARASVQGKGSGLGQGGGSTRMIMPPMWTMGVGAKSNGGTSINNEGLNERFLQNPKTCFLTNVSVDRDSSSLMSDKVIVDPRTREQADTFMPVSFALSLSFTEIDPLLRDDVNGGLISRSELRAEQGSIV